LGRFEWGRGKKYNSIKPSPSAYFFINFPLCRRCSPFALPASIIDTRPRLAVPPLPLCSSRDTIVASPLPACAGSAPSPPCPWLVDAIVASVPPPPPYAYPLAIAPQIFPSNRSIIFGILLANADASVMMILGSDDADAMPMRRHHCCTSAAAAAAAEPHHCNMQQPPNAASQLQHSAKISSCQRRTAISTPFHPFDCCVLRQKCRGVVERTP
jgi:hypothetical protein